MINFVKRRRLYYLISAIVIGAGLVAMFLSTRTYPDRSIVRLSVDFLGGSIFEVHFDPVEGQTAQEVDGLELTRVFEEAGLTDISTQRLGLTDTLNWQVRTGFVGNNPELLQTLTEKLREFAAGHGLSFNEAQFTENQSSVSPIVGGEVTTAALVATLAASVLVLFWIAWAFRGIKHTLRYGVCALLAMLHDVLVMVGAMSILGLAVGWQADALFLTGLLTVVGYSVQDTIVVFDRIRENETRHRGEPYEMIVNRSVTETIQRSLMTQIAVVFVLLALFLAGGGPIHQFVGVLAIGLVSGSYSSLFVAVPLLVSWERNEFPFNLLRRGQVQEATA